MLNLKKIPKSDLISLMNEEWNLRLAKLAELKDTALIPRKENGKKDEESILSPELRITDENGLEWEILSVSPLDVTLQGPYSLAGEKGKTTRIPIDKLSKFVLKPGGGGKDCSGSKKEKEGGKTSSTNRKQGEKDGRH
jgi:hypothetical protein